MAGVGMQRSNGSWPAKGLKWDKQESKTQGEFIRTHFSYLFRKPKESLRQAVLLSQSELDKSTARHRVFNLLLLLSSSVQSS